MANKALYDRTAATNVLSGLLYNFEYIFDEENFLFTPEDFTPGLHTIIFSAIYNMAHSGFKHIGPQDIEMFLGQFEKQHKRFTDEKGLSFLMELNEMQLVTDFDKINFYYKRLKKFRVLRELEDAGFDVKKIYNYEADWQNMEKENEQLNEYKMEDILNIVRGKIAVIEENYLDKKQKHGQNAGAGLHELFLELQANPEIGLPLEGDILNYTVRGARPGKLYLNSAPTGQGKTRFMVGNACALSLPRIEGDKVIYRDDMEKILFVATEQQADEIQTMIMSYVSGVNEKVILYNDYTLEQRKLVEQAITLIEEHKENFIIEYIPDPSISYLRAMMTRYILNEDVGHIFYDYIFSSPGLLSEFQSVGVREDVALMMLANTLKEIASTYNVYMQSATQLNDKWEKSLQRNQNHLRGSKAIADKVDIGMITVKLEECPEELEIISAIIEQAGLRTPNIVIDLYKNRRGQYSSHKILRTFDYGTCRVIEDICLMTSSHKIVENYDVLEYETIERDLLDVMSEAKARKVKEAKEAEAKRHE